MKIRSLLSRPNIIGGTNILVSTPGYFAVDRASDLKSMGGRAFAWFMVVVLFNLVAFGFAKADPGT